MFIRPTHFSASARLGLALQFGNEFSGQRVGRQRTGAVARMDAGFLDVLHDAGNMDVVPSQIASTSTRSRPADSGRADRAVAGDDTASAM